MKKLTPLNFLTYLSFVKKAAGAKSFQNAFVKTGSKKIDILKNGKLSCAFFVSSVLKIFGQINNIHATVEETVKDLENSGWKKLKTPKEGSILVWEEKNGHKHIGFYLGENKAISNNSKKRVPEIHHFAYNGKRKIESIYFKEFN
jgi:hypothetical protein